MYLRVAQRFIRFYEILCMLLLIYGKKIFKPLECYVMLILDPGYQMGSYVIIPVSGPSVGPSDQWWSVFKYLTDRLLVFSNFLHEVMAP